MSHQITRVKVYFCVDYLMSEKLQDKVTAFIVSFNFFHLTHPCCTLQGLLLLPRAWNGECLHHLFTKKK